MILSARHKVASFIRSVLIEAPAATVFAFHEREDALALLTPGFPPVRVLSRSGGIAGIWKPKIFGQWVFSSAHVCIVLPCCS